MNQDPKSYVLGRFPGAMVLKVGTSLFEIKGVPEVCLGTTVESAWLDAVRSINELDLKNAMISVKARTPNIEKLPSYARSRPVMNYEGLHIEPCLECGCRNIHLSDDNIFNEKHPNHNTGGGVCMNCGSEVNRNAPPNPTPTELAAIWNSCNDIKLLIEAEQKSIAASRSRIEWLQIRAVENEQWSTERFDEYRKMLTTHPMVDVLANFFWFCEAQGEDGLRYLRRLRGGEVVVWTERLREMIFQNTKTQKPSKWSIEDIHGLYLAALNAGDTVAADVVWDLASSSGQDLATIQKPAADCHQPNDRLPSWYGRA
ncbi:MAG: hypothetical protein V4713_03715 [Pseudomonadota bacterium]